MFNFMKKGGMEKEEKEKRKKEKKERKENKKRDRGSMTAEELLRLDEVRRSLKIRGRRKEKEKLPSGITADYSASFFASLEHGPDYAGGSSSLPGHHITSATPASPSPSSGTSSSWIRSGGGDTLTQSDSSEASLTSLNNPSTTSGAQQHSLPPLPPRPPKRGILKGPRLSGSSIEIGENVNHHGENNHSDSSILVRNTLQNEVIAYQNVPQRTTNNRLGASSSACFIVKESTSSLTLVSGVRDNIDGKSDQYHRHGSPPDSSRTSDECLPSSVGSGDHSAYLTAPIATGTNADPNSKLLTVTSTSPSADSLTDTTTTNSSFATPPFSLSPVGESQGFVGFQNRWNRYSSGGLEDSSLELPLPPVIPVPLPKPRELTIQRQPPPRGDFGFSLRRAMVTEKLPNGQQHTRAVIFAEPGVIVQHNNETGLLPGDRLLEVNGVAVDDKSREEIIDLIKSSGSSVTVKVQPVAELCELTRRSGLDGTEVELDDANIRGGTLRRSGSRRFRKTAQAKSEEQLASERAWLEAERLWLVHRVGFSAVRRLPEEFSGSGGGDSDASKLHVHLEVTGEVLQVDDDDVEKANPPQFDRAEDLAHLRYVNESSVLHTLRQRYGSNLIHTYAGGSMVIINPMAPLAIHSEKVVHMFRGCKSEDMPPHIYSLAQSAYHGMLASRRDHSVVLLGRSGSGKTTNFKHVLHYLVLAAGAVNKVVTVEKLNAISMVLEAFGNSRTVLNTNATRYTQIFSLDYDQSGQIASASVQVLLAERSRVARRPEGEPTFHIFYRLLAGAEGTLRRELHLDSLTGEPNLFMTPLQRHEDKQKAMLEFARVCAGMQTLGFSDVEMKVIWSVLAAIYHLGSAGAVKAGNSSSSRWQFSSPQAAQQAAHLLGTTVEELARILFGQSSGGMGTPSTPRAPFRTPSPTERGLDRDVTGLEALEGMVVGLYGEVLNAVAALVNRSISTPIHTVSSLVVVDSPGFQNPASCGQQGGATFEDLCHNYLQERLQLLFHHTTLVAPRDRYAQEHIELNLDEGGCGDVCTPGPLVSLLDRTSQNSMVRTSQTDLREADRRGLLWLLDEEAVYPSASDEGFLERLFTHYGDRDHQLLLRKAPGTNQFILQHLQGTNPVLYTASGWLKASKENPIVRSAVSLLQESSREEVNQLFVSVRGLGISSALGGSVVGIEGTQSLRRASSIRRTFTTGTAGIKRKSVCLQVKFTVDGLVETLRRTRLKFVHCFLPHHNAALGESARSGTLKSNSSLTGSNTLDDLINVPLVRSQLRGAQILDAVRLHKQGFPKFLPLSEFRRRFRLLAPADGRPASPVLDERRAVEDMLLGIDIDMASYRVGLSQIFFRSGVLAQLEAQRDERLTDNVVRLQARCRGYLARRKLNKLKIQDLAVRCIQRNVRKFMSVRDWPWWRLLVRVTPLLNVHRTEEELRIKTEELEQLRSKVEKLEQERTHLKHDNDRLEAKLSEITADLAEEHSTSTLATERLEAETADRLRLEKELQDVQCENRNLQQTTERLEMELLYMRAADVNGGVGSDEDGEGEEDAGVYKQRYERTVRELEFTRRRLQQQHEDDLEQLVGLKKQLEKKLADAYEEVEEQRQVVGQWKRKVQKLTTETNDLRLLLEEQSSRNHLLEKKQRKFDSELQLLHDELRQEKQQKDRISREKELITAEKYSLEQNLSAVHLELELKEEKVATLAQELDELTFGGKTEEEVAHLKKTKHEMDKKLKEQEEELDDLAGQVQLLEQAKLRLEMSLEQQRKENRREVAQRDEELEDIRCNAHKKVKALEAQLESEHEERTQLVKEKHELERRLGALEEAGRASRATDEDQLHRLRKDLRRTKALLRDAQTQLERSRGDSPGKAILRQLRNQLEDLECARAAAVKARQSAEMELAEGQAQLDEAQRLRAEAEERAAAATRERSDIRTQLEENEEELAEVLKKYRVAVQQLSMDQMALQEQASLVAELESERAALKEQLAELSSRLESIETQGDPSSSLAQRRLELRTKELESRLDLEQTTRARMEVQISRLKETTEKLQGEAVMARTKEQTAQDAARKLQRTVRELKEAASAGQARESEAAQRRKDLEKRLESAEAEAVAARGDLRLALTRIQDLQSAIQGELEDCSGSDHTDSDQDSDCSDESINTFLSNHKMPLVSSTANSTPRVRTALELDISSRSLKSATKLCKNVKNESQDSFA